MVLVKRTFIAEQLHCYIDEQAAIATAKKQFEECVATANKVYEEQLALQDRWKALLEQCQVSSQKKAKSQGQAA